MSGLSVEGLLEARGPLVLVVDPAGRIRALNRALAELLGYAPADLVGTSPRERLLVPEDAARFEDFLSRARSGACVLFEAHWRTRGGATRWLALAGERQAGGAGEPEVAFVGLDRSEPERVRQALRGSEAKFAGIIAIAADAIVSVDESQRIVLFNAGAEKIFGWSAEEIIGQPLDVLIPERFRARHRVDMETFAHGPVVARKMGERQVDVWGLRKDGEEFPAEASISKLEISGRLLLTAAMRDVTERRAVEAEQRFLAEVGTRLGQSLDAEKTLATVAALAVSFLADFCMADLLEDDASLARIAVAHADPSQGARAEPLRQIRVARDGPSLGAQALRQRKPLLLRDVGPGVLESFAQGPVHLEALRRLAPRSMMAVPLIARGRALGVLQFVRTSRRYGPDELRLAGELAVRASSAVDNALLFEAEQRAVRGRDEVLRVVAHDLRNPLNAIGLAARALATGEPDADTLHKRANAILRSSARMGRLIEDLLDLARMESGRLTLKRAPMAPGAILDAALELERPLVLAAGLTLERLAGPACPDVSADADRIQQVLENLIGNATKFTPAGGRISVGARPEGGGVVFWVTDTGPGIAVEQQARLFDRFWQGRSTDRRGAGLGLAICKGIVDAHGGALWVESRPGTGSTFSFRLPAAGPDGPQAAENRAVR